MLVTIGRGLGGVVLLAILAPVVVQMGVNTFLPWTAPWLALALWFIGGHVCTRLVWKHDKELKHVFRSWHEFRDWIEYCDNHLFMIPAVLWGYIIQGGAVVGTALVLMRRLGWI